MHRKTSANWQQSTAIPLQCYSLVIVYVFLHFQPVVHNMSRDGWETGTVLEMKHSLPPEPDLPRSARERWMGFFVWCLCFLNRTKLIFSLSSGPINPSSIWRSMMSSTGDKRWSGLLCFVHWYESKTLYCIPKNNEKETLLYARRCSVQRLRWFRKHQCRPPPLEDKHPE